MEAGWKAKPGEEVIVAAHDPPEQFSSLALEQFISSSLLYSKYISCSLALAQLSV